MGHIILGRPWLFDKDVTILGRANSCTFTYEGKMIKLNPLLPSPVNAHELKKIEEKDINIISPTEFEKEIT